MAATTLVAAPFTFGSSRSVGAVGLDDMELLAQYSFESGYTDSVRGEAGELSEATSGSVTLEKDGTNTYLSVQGAPATYNNVVMVANPFKGDAATDMTIAMNVRVDSSTTSAFQGLWAIIQEEAGSWVGLCASGRI